MDHRRICGSRRILRIGTDLGKRGPRGQETFEMGDPISSPDQSGIRISAHIWNLLSSRDVT